MIPMPKGCVVILNGAPRSGKSSIALAMQEMSQDIWVQLGVDHAMKSIPQRCLPGIGLRPGGERPDMEPLVEAMAEALYGSIAAHSKAGLNVAVDIGHHDMYSRELHLLRRCARMLHGLPSLLVGVFCPIEDIMRRRIETGYNISGDGVPDPVLRWQREVHRPGVYDVSVDTSLLTAQQAAEMILRATRDRGPSAALVSLASN